jgi:hypothetical protein
VNSYVAPSTPIYLICRQYRLSIIAWPYKQASLN